MANVRGAPTLPGNPALSADFEFRGAYQGDAAGLGVGRIRAQYDYAADVWEVGGAALDLPLGGEGDPAPQSALVVTFYLPTGDTPELAVLPCVSPGLPYLDLRRPHYAPGFVSSLTLEQMLAEGRDLAALKPDLLAARDAATAAGEQAEALATAAATEARAAATEARAAVSAYNGTALFLVGETERGPIVTSLDASKLERRTVALNVLGQMRPLHVISARLG